MKRKTIVLLSSIMASALVVGGAFAAYAVTDAADPFGINVTPGDLDVDDTTYVTLKWGEATNLTSIGNLKVGENRKAGLISLQATPAYEGVFSLSIRDNTIEQKEAEAAKLLDYLNVYVYTGDQELGNEGALPQATPKASIVKATVADTDGKKVLAFNAEGTPAGAEYSVFVNLDSSANPVFTQMSKDKVYLEVEWAPKTGDAAENVVYFAKPNEWEEVKAYAWNGDKVNGAWPGVNMVHAYDNIYQISIPTDAMNSIIFNDGNGHQTADLTFEGYNKADAPYWNGTAWAAKPEQQVVAVVSATIDGEPVEELVDETAGQGTATDKAVYKLDLKIGEVVAFKYGNEVVMFGDQPTFTATIEGEHTFYYSKDGSMYVGQPVPETVYYLVGLNDKWGIADGIQMTKVDDTHYKAEGVVFDGADDMVKVTDGGSLWRGVKTDGYDGCNYTVVGDGNLKPIALGTYTVHFYVNSEYENYLGIEAEA